MYQFFEIMLQFFQEYVFNFDFILANIFLYKNFEKIILIKIYISGNNIQKQTYFLFIFLTFQKIKRFYILKPNNFLKT